MGQRERAAGEPSGNPVKVQGSGRGRVLQARLGQATIARPALAEGAHSLRDGALDALPLRIETLVRIGVDYG